MGNHLAPASRHPQPQPSPDPAAKANNGGDSSSASSSNDGDFDVDVPALPQDVLFDILLRLPARQLCPLRAVCRSWRSVLSDPLFVAAHARHHPDLLVVAPAGVDLLYDAAASAGRRVVRRVTSRVAGAALPSSRPRYYRTHLGRVLVVGADELPRVLDPDTGAESLLPDHGGYGEPDTFFVLGWAAPAAASKGGYKVLNITLDRGRHVQRCKVLTLGVGGVGGAGGGVRRKAPNTPVDVKREPWWTAVASNGVVYIVACGRRKRADWIATFDLSTERWRRRGLIRGPPASNALSSLTTETGGGRLVAVCGSSASAVRLWRVVGGGDDGDPEAAAVWHKMCTLRMSRIQRAGGGHHERFDDVAKPLWVLDGGRIAFLVWSPLPAGYNYWVLRVYDPRTKGFEDVARMSYYMDVAIGVYSANNLLRAQGVH